MTVNCVTDYIHYALTKMMLMELERIVLWRGSLDFLSEEQLLAQSVLFGIAVVCVHQQISLSLR